MTRTPHMLRLATAMLLVSTVRALAWDLEDYSYAKVVHCHQRWPGVMTVDCYLKSDPLNPSAGWSTHVAGNTGWRLIQHVDANGWCLASTDGSVKLYGTNNATPFPGDWDTIISAYNRYVPYPEMPWPGKSWAEGEYIPTEIDGRVYWEWFDYVDFGTRDDIIIRGPPEVSIDPDEIIRWDSRPRWSSDGTSVFPGVDWPYWIGSRDSPTGELSWSPHYGTGTTPEAIDEAGMSPEGTYLSRILDALERLIARTGTGTGTSVVNIAASTNIINVALATNIINVTASTSAPVSVDLDFSEVVSAINEVKTKVGDVEQAINDQLDSAPLDTPVYDASADMTTNVIDAIQTAHASQTSYLAQGQAIIGVATNLTSTYTLVFPTNTFGAAASFCFTVDLSSTCLHTSLVVSADLSHPGVASLRTLLLMVINLAFLVGTAGKLAQTL